MNINTTEENNSMESFERDFTSSLRKTAEACDIAITDILSARELDGKIDMKTVKDIAATLKDLNGLGGGQTVQPVSVLFSPEAERYGV